jgi:hypothetical protein
LTAPRPFELAGAKFAPDHLDLRQQTGTKLHRRTHDPLVDALRRGEARDKPRTIATRAHLEKDQRQKINRKGAVLMRMAKRVVRHARTEQHHIAGTALHFFSPDELRDLPRHRPSQPGLRAPRSSGWR